ncbi:helix-turn-helix domain-containing protein [Hydrocarboniphaga sp.]|uniref:helix-turn-helix domain-containing protein n=1 Tax=Hydrocarboniphaga sp. TaxID=2033016 RepID=UPI003D0BBA86
MRELTAADVDLIERKLADALGGAQYALQLLELDGGRRYIGARPDKRQRIDAIAAIPQLTEAQVAEQLGMSPRQVRRYRALLKVLSGEAR